MDTKMLDLLIAVGKNYVPRDNAETCILGGYEKMKALTEPRVDCQKFNMCVDCIFCSGNVSKVKEMQDILKTMELLDE